MAFVSTISRFAINGYRLLLILGLACCAVPSFGQSNLKVNGLGWFANREFGQMLAFLNDTPANEAIALSSTLIEDNAFILMARLGQLGYLDPVIEIEFIDGDGIERQYRWQSPYQPAIASEYEPEEAVFKLKPGIRAVYETVRIHGVEFMTDRELEAYFIPQTALFSTRGSRYFTLKNLGDRVDALLADLEDLGYREARLIGRTVETDPETGATDVELRFETGPVYYVSAVEIEDDGADDVSPVLVSIEPELHTRAWVRDLRQERLNKVVAQGFPDATLRSSIIREEVIDENTVHRFVRLAIRRGPHIVLRSVRFDLSETMRESVLRRQAALSVGEPLNLIEANEARRRLLGLGVFRSVRIDQEDAGGGERDIVFTPEPGMRQELSVLGGWGSYEMARVGFLWRHNNPFGRAHRYDFDGKQSFKSRNLGVRYTIPQIFGTDLEAFARVRYAFREELTFERDTVGLSLGTSVVFPRNSVFASFEYTIERQSVERRQFAERRGPENATVAGFLTRVGLDRRNSSIYPETGYSIGANTLISSEYLGAQVDFQRLELAFSYHRPLGGSRTIHTGLRYGALFAFGGADENIPFNERFFPGGEGTQRGFQQGEASPVDASGNQLGAEAYVLANLEIEQRVVGNLSLVAFADILGTSLALSGWGTDEFLYAAGLGLRFRTPVGPVRLEYGRNLNPRAGDPAGTVHFSVGFPF